MAIDFKTLLRDKNSSPRPVDPDAPRVVIKGDIIGFSRLYPKDEPTKKKLGWELIDYHADKGALGPHVSFHLRGGSTGYESFILKEGEKWSSYTLHGMYRKYWAACFGTPGKYSELRIHYKEMRRVFTQILQHYRMVACVCYECPQGDKNARVLSADRITTMLTGKGESLDPEFPENGGFWDLTSGHPVNIVQKIRGRGSDDHDMIFGIG